MSFIGGSLPKIKEDEDEDSWKPGQVGTLGTELNKNINKWISENTWERIPEQYREAIKIGVELGTYSGSHFADGTPKPIKSEWLLNLHPAVLKYKGARSVASRGLNINPGLFDKGAIIGGTSALDNGSGGSAVCAKKFAVGDIIHAEDDIILGEIASLTTNTITFRHDGVKQYHAGGEVLYNTPTSLEDWKKQNGDGATDQDLADGDELYNAHPITVRLSFER